MEDGPSVPELLVLIAPSGYYPPRDPHTLRTVADLRTSALRTVPLAQPAMALCDLGPTMPLSSLLLISMHLQMH